MWRSARTFEDLCALGARFVEGEIELFPGWGAVALDAESAPLVPSLAALNRAGVLTVASQPGRVPTAGPDGRESAQRAFVCGFARESTALRIERLARETDLAVTVFGPGASGGSPSPVSVHAGQPCVFAGHAAFEAEIACFEDHLAPEALAALSRAHWISAFDPVWGRGPDLWRFLATACAGTGA